jgi:hypothetical protein
LRGSWVLLAAGLALLPAACGDSSDDDDNGAAAKAGAGGAGTGGSGGKAGAGGGKAGASGKGGQAGGAGTSGGTAGTAGTADAGAGASGGAEDAGAGGTSAGTGGTSAGTGGSAGMDGEGGSAGEIEIPEEAYLLVEAFCATARTCCEAAGEPVGALADCEDAAAGGVYTFELVAKGTVTLNMKALTACVDAYEAAEKTCYMGDVTAACHGIFDGTLADGEDCSDAFECDRSAGPKVCEIVQQGSPDPSVGTCVDPPRGTLGTPCGGSCEEDTNCSVTSISAEAGSPVTLCWEEDGLYCPLGESCAAIVADGEDCDWDQACGSDGYCLETCETRGEVDDECSFSPACGAGLVCEGAMCIPEPFANPYTCVARMPDMD